MVRTYCVFYKYGIQFREEIGTKVFQIDRKVNKPLYNWYKFKLRSMSDQFLQSGIGASSVQDKASQEEDNASKSNQQSFKPKQGSSQVKVPTLQRQPVQIKGQIHERVRSQTSCEEEILNQSSSEGQNNDLKKCGKTFVNLPKDRQPAQLNLKKKRNDLDHQNSQFTIQHHFENKLRYQDEKQYVREEPLKQDEFADRAVILATQDIDQQINDSFAKFEESVEESNGKLLKSETMLQQAKEKLEQLMSRPQSHQGPMLNQQFQQEEKSLDVANQEMDPIQQIPQQMQKPKQPENEQHRHQKEERSPKDSQGSMRNRSADEQEQVYQSEILLDQQDQFKEKVEVRDHGQEYDKLIQFVGLLQESSQEDDNSSSQSQDQEQTQSRNISIQRHPQENRISAVQMNIDLIQCLSSMLRLQVMHLEYTKEFITSQRKFFEQLKKGVKRRQDEAKLLSEDLRQQQLNVSEQLTYLAAYSQHLDTLTIQTKEQNNALQLLKGISAIPLHEEQQQENEK